MLTQAGVGITACAHSSGVLYRRAIGTVICAGELGDEMSYREVCDVQTGQEALDAVDSFFETTWGAQATPAPHPAAEEPPPHPGLQPQQHQHLPRQGSHADAHALAAHAAMGSYALVAAQQNGGISGPPAHSHTARSAMLSRRSSFDGALHALCRGCPLDRVTAEKTSPEAEGRCCLVLAACPLDVSFAQGV
jgi:hypothetical protein